MQIGKHAEAWELHRHLLSRAWNNLANDLDRFFFAPGLNVPASDQPPPTPINRGIAQRLMDPIRDLADRFKFGGGVALLFEPAQHLAQNLDRELRENLP
jgi:hypothetical protein